jgi:hypothetical protein
VTGSYTLRMPLGTVVLEVEVTAEQAAALAVGRPIVWYGPEVPDITVDDDGTIIEHEDARPQPRD